MGTLATDHLSCDNHHFFEGVLPMLDDVEPLYDSVLSTEESIHHDVAST